MEKIIEQQDLNDISVRTTNGMESMYVDCIITQGEREIWSDRYSLPALIAALQEIEKEVNGE